MLGLEALSRGAGHVVFVEKNRLQANQLAKNIRVLQARDCDLVIADSLQWLQQCDQAFDIIFLDPPFHQGLLEESCNLLREHHCIYANSQLYIESEISQAIPFGIAVRKEQIAGKVKFMLVEMI